MAEKKQQTPVMKIFVGYKTRLKSGAETNVPTFEAPANYRDKDKIASYVAESKVAFLADARNMPYTGTFDEVYLIDPNAFDEKKPEIRRTKALQYKHPLPEETKAPVCVRVRNYLLKHYPDAWSDDTHGRKPPQVIFVGFNPRTFIKMLGLECTMPGVDKPCPLGMWYDNSDHRDIGEAVCPRDFKGLTLPFVLKQRRPLDEAEGKHWDETIKGWNGPGENPEQDARIAVELATQLGFLSE